MSTTPMSPHISMGWIARVPGVAWVLLLLVLTFAALSRNFLQPGNLANIGEQSVVLLILALPMTLVIMTEGIDMSMGAVLTLASVVLAWTVVGTGSIPLGLLAAVAAGVVFGAANGGLVSALKLPPFIVTLGTMGVAQGLALLITDGDSIVVGPALTTLYSGSFVSLSFPMWLAVACYGVCHVLLHHTRFGTYVCAIGGNRDALALAGVAAGRYHVAVYVLAGAMAGLAALVLTARMSAGHPTAAIGMEFDAIAATIVGGTSFERGNGWLFGTLLGVIAVGVLRNGLNLLNVQSAVQVSCIGLLVIVALLVDGMKGRA
jgi:ribose transport system permease protein